jgi:hypothetical protein
MKKRKTAILVIVIFVAAFAAAQNQTSSEDTSIGVNATASCEVQINRFLPPGEIIDESDTKFGLVTLGKMNESYFTMHLYNEGNQHSNMSLARFNITYEGNDSWQPGERIGPNDRGPNESYFNITYNDTELDSMMKNLTSDDLLNANGTNVTHFSMFDLDNDGEIEWDDPSDYVLNYLSLSKSIVVKNLDPGWYTGRLKVSSRCLNHTNSTGQIEKFPDDYDYSGLNNTNSDYVNFRVINSSKGGSGDSVNGTAGGVNDTGDTEAPPNASNATNPGGNGTFPTDANETGGSGDTVEGNNDQPGVTPQPEPEPEPEPIPQLSMDIESVESIYEGPPGQFIPANLSITNEGNTVLNQLTVAPQVENRGEGWAASNAQIASLAVNQTVYRQVLVQPAADAETRLYTIPVLGSNPENELDVDYFAINVTRNLSENLSSQIEIVESPRSVNVRVNKTTQLPILVRNNGRTNLTNVTGRLQNIGECGEVEIGDISELDSNSSESLSFEFESATTSQSCNTTLILSSSEGAYAFSKISFTVLPKEGLIPEKYRVPFIAIAWTGLLAIFAVVKRRYEMKTGLVKAPFVLLVAGEALIFIYLLVDYYQLVSASFLPF